MLRLFTAILFFTLIFGAQYTSAADVSRLRLMIPVSASSEAEGHLLISVLQLHYVETKEPSCACWVEVALTP